MFTVNRIEKYERGYFNRVAHQGLISHSSVEEDSSFLGYDVMYCMQKT
jgi:hypothetical protein